MLSHNEMKAQIRAKCMEEMESYGIDHVDPATCLAFYQGLYQGWQEDTDESLEKTFWQLALLDLITIERQAVVFGK